MQTLVMFLLLFHGSQLYAQDQRNVTSHELKIDSIRLVDVGFVTRKLSESCFLDTVNLTSVSLNKVEVIRNSNTNCVFKISSKDAQFFFMDSASYECKPVLEYLEMIGIYWPESHYVELIPARCSFLSDSETYLVSYRFKRRNLIVVEEEVLIETNEPEGEEIIEIVRVLISKRHKRSILK